VAVEIFPFMLFGGIAVLALVGIVSFRSQREVPAGDPAGSRGSRRRSMQRVRAVCWVALTIAVLGAIAYIMVPARTPGP